MKYNIEMKETTTTAAIIFFVANTVLFVSSLLSMYESKKYTKRLANLSQKLRDNAHALAVLRVQLLKIKPDERTEK